MDLQNITHVTTGVSTRISLEVSYDNGKTWLLKSYVLPADLLYILPDDWEQLVVQLTMAIAKGKGEPITEATTLVVKDK